MSERLALARSVIQQEAEALAELARCLDSSFERAVRRILALGRSAQLFVTGVGKSGIIARKVAATLSSTGTPAVFIHPVEGLHGDLGSAGPDDLLLAFSKSGQTEELVRFAGHFKRIGGHVLAVCEPNGGGLAELAEIVLPLPKRGEAGPLALAPTTSTTMMLALGDALAMALLEARGFREEDFAKYHPEGVLGRRLLLRASDLMHGGDAMPRVALEAGFRELLSEMTAKHLGMVCLVDGAGRFEGVFSEGDLRRLLERHDKPMSLRAQEAWQASRRAPGDVPVVASTVPPTMLAVDCLELMRRSQITALVVVDASHAPVGVVRMHDLVKAGLS